MAHADTVHTSRTQILVVAVLFSDLGSSLNLNLALQNALARVEQELEPLDVVQEFVEFVRQSQRGINRVQGVRLDAAA